MLVGARLGWVSALVFLCMPGCSMVMTETNAQPARRREYLSAVRFHGKPAWIQQGSVERDELRKARRGKRRPRRTKKYEMFLFCISYAYRDGRLSTSRRAGDDCHGGKGAIP